MKDALTILVGAIAAIVAIWQAYTFVSIPYNTADPGTKHLIIAIVAGLIAIACGIVFGAGRVNKEEEIHITQ